ncbi:histidine kinase dimerization/phosphoacceptor domain -containing protein [Lutibacter sp.]|uniref:tetratricopeptide repeat-containing sensor histidine kinase n=1 Tax=Lutibacter sp. TaxID=1925666 RepID=UPI0025C40F21|nr:histidine kinase dimerization/phosphoacceptor domain -containing protein [Lutibacter sp.]MCF6181773.1 tetratricopeptide repeat protein [Lutibacter sp.]
MFGIYIEIGSYSKAWEAIRTRDNVLSNTQIQNSFFDSFKKIRINDLARIYLETNKYNEAIEQYQQLIEIAKKDNNLFYEAGTNNNLGLVYLRMHKPDSAITNFNQSIYFWNKYLKVINFPSVRDRMFLDIVKSNIGQAYNDKGEYQKAIPLIRNYIDMNIKINEGDGIVIGLNSLSQSYLGLHQPKKALALLDSANYLMKKNKSVFGIKNTYQNKVKVYEYLGNTKKAYSYYKKLVAYNNSKDTIENTKRTAILEVVYEVEQKNKQIANQQIRVIEAESSRKFQKDRQKLLIIGMLLMLVIVIGLLWNGIQKRKKTRILKEKSDRIEEQNDIIEKTLVEKETLLKEIHHRVKNNLQLISGMLELQSSKINDDDVREIMEQGQNRIKSMALIHQQLYESEDLGEIDFKKYVIQLTNDIIITVNDTNKNIGIVLDSIDFSLDINTAVPMGLIINELVVNAFKHGFSNKKEGTITITLKALEDEYYQLTIYDNGNGLPANFNINNTNSLGLRLVKGLSRQIGGSCEFKNGTGTTVIIKFRNDNN